MGANKNGFIWFNFFFDKEISSAQKCSTLFSDKRQNGAFRGANSHFSDSPIARGRFLPNVRQSVGAGGVSAS